LWFTKAVIYLKDEPYLTSNKFLELRTSGHYVEISWSLLRWENVTLGSLKGESYVKKSLSILLGSDRKVRNP